jgi:uncharacterized membrane protein YphA (DoxX/SURF4 family)
MTTIVLPAAIVLALLLLWVSLWLSRTPEGQRQGGLGVWTRFFLILLRLSIGWHFLVEGLDKLKSPSWSSEVYLREATGPLAPFFRDLAGDRLVDLLSLDQNGRLSPDLEAQWDAYVSAVNNYYALDDKQQALLDSAIKQVRANTEKLLSQRQKRVEKIAPYPPPLLVKMTMPERLKEYGRLEDAVRQAEEQLAQAEEQIFADEGPEVFDRLKTAKANLARWRSGLRKDLARINRDMKRALESVLLSEVRDRLPEQERAVIEMAQKKIEEEAKKEKIDPTDWDGEERARDKWDEKLLETYRSILAAATDGGKRLQDLEPLTRKVYPNIIERRGKNQAAHELLPFTVSRPIASWQLLDWSDAIVKYGLTAAGVCLLLGFFTRSACIVGAAFLLMFFLAMPPLAGWPANPRAEGHYLYINKNIIEMLALLTLATTHSGRWLGLDGLLRSLCPWCKRNTPERQPSSTSELPRPSAAERLAAERAPLTPTPLPRGGGEGQG